MQKVRCPAKAPTPVTAHAAGVEGLVVRRRLLWERRLRADLGSVVLGLLESFSIVIGAPEDGDMFEAVRG
jgi:hypothetical protein